MIGTRSCCVVLSLEEAIAVAAQNIAILPRLTLLLIAFALSCSHPINESRSGFGSILLTEVHLERPLIVESSSPAVADTHEAVATVDEFIEGPGRSTKWRRLQGIGNEPEAGCAIRGHDCLLARDRLNGRA